MGALVVGGERRGMAVVWATRAFLQNGNVPS